MIYTMKVITIQSGLRDNESDKT